MPAQNSDAPGSFLANPNALLALLTIVGGLWLVSRNLTSDRPVTPAGGAREFVGDQQFEARLWEDPFRAVTTVEHDGPPQGASTVSADLNTLVRQIERRNLDPTSPVLLLPVMLSGGQYSEDQESRIRSRLAIVSALGESGYMPEDAEHIGALRIPWLTQDEVEQAKQGAEDGSLMISRLWEDAPASDKASVPRLLGVEASSPSGHMELRYEWYRSRVFSAGAGHDRQHSHVLVLWLDDSYFEDSPLLRLPLLLEKLTDPSCLTEHSAPPTVALIGPRRSSTLRNMLPDRRPGPPTPPDSPGHRLEALARPVLGRIEMFCATPSAMDELLVPHPVDPDLTPRASIRKALEGEGFHSVHTFGATDAQLARAVLDELRRRDVGLTRSPQGGVGRDQVVLISEWDTFYARMLSLTYGAELAVMQGTVGSRAEFVDDFVSQDRRRALPGNFHSFVYLRGLDGQTVGANTETKDDGSEKRRTGRSSPMSIEELRHWAPDINKAEGPAQFDYLGRLGDRMDELRQTLRRQGGGEIKAIGIVGSDVYDTLLILQALRHRFPGALFFTTDLDVRFLNPLEREWARNLIVASSYGLALSRELQGKVAPFRDSTQTAEFAAALAALGNEDLLGLQAIPPRLFEVGNRTAVDLSVAGSAALTQSSGHVQLHPMTTSERRQAELLPDHGRVWWGLTAAALVLAGISWGWRPLRRLTWNGLEFTGSALEYSEEDIGGPDGAWALVRRLKAGQAGTIGGWLAMNPRVREICDEPEGDAVVGPAGDNPRREERLAELTALLVNLLNRLLRRDARGAAGEPPMPVIRVSVDERSIGWASKLRRWPQACRVMELRLARAALDDFLLEVAPPPSAYLCKRGDGDERCLPDFDGRDARACAGDPIGPDSMAGEAPGGRGAPGSGTSGESRAIEESTLATAFTARQAGRGLFRLHCRKLIGFWASVVGFGSAGLILAVTIWNDTFARPEGQPFSLSSGTSAWPAEVLRLLVFASAVCLSFELSFQMREAFLQLTREFRLSFPNADGGPADRVCAGSIWKEYGEGGTIRRRLKRIGLVMVAYFVLLMAISKASGESLMMPLRGKVLLQLNSPVLIAAFVGFLLLAFLTVDAACLCRRFIDKLSARPTLYPLATRRHFSRQMGRIADEYLDEWIDLQLIAELTERVDRLVYYPACLVLLMLVARNSWWDCWSWPVSLLVGYLLNFILSLACVVILQRAAKGAKRKAEQSLTAKIKKLQAQTAPSAAQNNSNQAEKLLDEIRQLDRGAFVPFWENPVVGAIFLSSGGTTLLQVFVLLLGR
jgi:hypothetical protein